MASLAAAALVVSVAAAVLFGVSSSAAPYGAALACLAWGFAGGKQLSSSAGSGSGSSGSSVGSRDSGRSGALLFQVGLSALGSRQEQMRARGCRNLVPESLMLPDTDVSEFLYLSAGKAKRDSAGDHYRTCVGLLRVAGRPACIRVDVPEDFLLQEGAAISGEQAGDVVREFAKAKAIVA